MKPLEGNSWQLCTVLVTVLLSSIIEAAHVVPLPPGDTTLEIELSSPAVGTVGFKQVQPVQGTIVEVFYVTQALLGCCSSGGHTPLHMCRSRPY